ncbi:MAG: membrane protein insertase YidC, partial [Verrucomicrobiae bacterium]|nr:membrane protein insertase YidC [Verrucomicrobiae bacterium]
AAKEPAKTEVAKTDETTKGASAAAVEAADPPAPGSPAAETAVLENDYIRLHLTSAGAGIARAEMKKHPRHLGEDSLITVNETASHPVAALSSGPKRYDTSVWSVASKSSEEVVFETTDSEGLKWRKTIRLPGSETDPYEVTVMLEAQNTSQAAVELSTRYLYTGSAAPLHLNEWSMQIGSYWMAKDGDFEYKTVDHFGGRKVLGIFGGEEKPHDLFAVNQLHWAGVNDQFFTTIVRPTQPYEGEVWISRFPVTVEGDEAASRKKRMFASEAALSLPKESVAPGATAKVEYGVYLGPKEYARLRGLGDRRERVMHYDAIPIFGWLFGWAIKPIASVLILGLVKIKGVVGDYGIAIILITILIRLLIWPVYAKSARTMKRMSKLTPLMQEIREKHADNPQKMNEETMKLYQTYGINPLGGCLPMFIQLPVFLAFYRMLWSAVELRHESFLWVTDLSMPDTLLTIPGLNVDLNPLPILMGITSFIQIAITPKTGDKTQQTIFMLMPFMFLFICYNFASALALYWTVSNSFTIFQTWIMNKLPEPELTKRTGGRKGWMQKLAEQAESAQRAKGGDSSLPSGPGSRTKMPGEKGDRHTKGKKKRR